MPASTASPTAANAVDLDALYTSIEEAHSALRPAVSITPLSHSARLSALTGCEVLLKWCAWLGKNKVWRQATPNIHYTEPNKQAPAPNVQLLPPSGQLSSTSEGIRAIRFQPPSTSGGVWAPRFQPSGRPNRP